jgi:hypothetical protein
MDHPPETVSPFSSFIPYQAILTHELYAGLSDATAMVEQMLTPCRLPRFEAEFRGAANEWQCPAAPAASSA